MRRWWASWHSPGGDRRSTAIRSVDSGPVSERNAESGHRLSGRVNFRCTMRTLPATRKAHSARPGGSAERGGAAESARPRTFKIQLALTSPNCRSRTRHRLVVPRRKMSEAERDRVPPRIRFHDLRHSHARCWLRASTSRSSASAWGTPRWPSRSTPTRTSCRANRRRPQPPSLPSSTAPEPESCAAFSACQNRLLPSWSGF
jgi:hypothetical protein